MLLVMNNNNDLQFSARVIGALILVKCSYESLVYTSRESPSGLYVGRIPEGQYEYPDLNGWMTTKEAIDLCENDAKCGGFTYKVTGL